eukprot:gnl/TRDRNA2_/TRDRNA2_154634_c3_seq1.p1 gnl/TRDRNA2_/TRDRNA2_154634_c3~~gnl/TRDRNA2_/TRDRNA2_154634_c3_seq1.p1  ORF type:complete len:245 (+),score=28.36 gnl/TRDRNA2_/TRDRNA2_154634_c3_seq1:3-737(+)
MFFVALGKLGALPGVGSRRMSASDDAPGGAERRMSLGSELGGSMDKHHFRRMCTSSFTPGGDEALFASPMSSANFRRASVFSLHSIGSELLSSQASACPASSSSTCGGVQPQVTSVFEKGMWFDDLCLFKDVVRIKTIVSLVDSELLVVSRSNLLKLRDRFPEMAEYYDHVQQRVLDGGLSGAGFVCAACRRPGHSFRNCPSTKKASSGNGEEAAPGPMPNLLRQVLATAKGLISSDRSHAATR